MPQEGYILPPGTRLWGRYIIGTVLGVGGFGITYRAWDTRLNTMLAIKEFYPKSLISRIPGETKVRVFSGDSQETYKKQLARFMDEAKNLAKFTGDEHIVNVLDFFEDNGTAYIVMEYLEGMTLKEYMASHGGRLPPEQSLAIASALLKATSRIHSIGIIHRDISPDNIFVLSAGSIKVLDFGAAQFTVKDNSGLSQEVVVKKGYAPPEQYRTNMKQGVWTDIYAVGATLYKMTTGITPDESIERTEKDDLKRPSQTGTDVDMIIDKAVMKAMALRPELRFKTADAMLAALENRTVIDFPEEELKKRHTRNRIAIAVSVLVVVALGALVAWQATRQPEQVIVMAPGAPSLASLQINPDTITLFVGEWESETMTKLAEAFMDAYPEHAVIVEIYGGLTGQAEWERFAAEIAGRFASSNAPTIFQSHMSSLNHRDTPYMADLSMLYNAMDMSEYVLLSEYFEETYGGSDGSSKEILDIPLDFAFQMAYVNLAGAHERGMEPPAFIDSYEQIMAWEREMPRSVQLDPYAVGNILTALKPELRENGKIQPVEDLFGEYARMWQQGYFMHGRYIPEMQSSYMYPLLEFGDSRTETRRWRQQSGQQQLIIPLVSDGQIYSEVWTRYSVSSRVSENQQRVGMLFLHFALSDNGQNVLTIQNDGVQPLNKKTLEQYVGMNPEFAFLTTEYVDKLTFKRRGGIYIDGLYDILQDRGYNYGEEDERDYEDAVRKMVRHELSRQWGWQ